jgi:NTP pyrophosphatase (non-canonical NTP hydrolase)
MINQVQEELKPWVKHNFGDRPSWQPLLGIQEEVGELSHAYLKRAQGIRVNENHTEAIKDAVADIIIYLCDFCNTENINLEEQIAKTWAEVSKRNWKANPEKGV